MRLTILFIVFVSACNAPKAVNNNSTDPIPFVQIAEDQLGGTAQCLKNQSETMVLCVNESPSTPEQPRNTVSFMVISLDDSSVIYESSIDGGNVKWFDDERLEIFNTPGYVRQDQTNDDFTKIYELKTQTMIPKKEYLEK
ncbi:MAG: hypothetical protein ABJH98_02105 [Reichenbachiella sp.]|uniref:hypothetical protein n=1 Tax=Reichenbachiella sp. TaxID=2184521 RepID=UPI003297001F